MFMNLWNFNEFNIAKPEEQPSRQELVEVGFGLRNCFYKMDRVII